MNARKPHAGKRKNVVVAKPKKRLDAKKKHEPGRKPPPPSRTPVVVSHHYEDEVQVQALAAVCGASGVRGQVRLLWRPAVVVEGVYLEVQVHHTDSYCDVLSHCNPIPFSANRCFDHHADALDWEHHGFWRWHSSTELGSKQSIWCPERCC